MVSQEKIIEWASHPELLDKETLYELRKVVNTYPFYQLARILFLKNLYLLDKSEFKAELKKGVLYVADVSLLFYYLEGDKFKIASKVKAAETGCESDSDRTLALIDDFLNDDEESGNTENSLIPEVPVDYTSILLKEDEDSAENVPTFKGQDLIDDFLRQADSEGSAMYRFEANEPTQPRQTESAGERLPEADANEETDAVPEIVVQVSSEENADESDTADDEDTEDNVLDEVDEDSSLSETLAKIYIKQHKYDKALEIIKKLNLKYPKKNAYFADQIRFLEKLIINTKSK